jgi:threonine/homoserine/homoserine lactone efflux protein
MSFELWAAFVLATSVLLGAGAILSASATAFTILKLVGAAYLVWLGINLWRSDPRLDTSDSTNRPKSGRAMFWHAYVVTALNPKGIVFFVAFVPQFVDPNESLLLQFFILETTFVTLAGITVAGWAVATGRIREKLTRPQTLVAVNRTGACCLISAGLLTALLRPNA